MASNLTMTPLKGLHQSHIFLDTPIDRQPFQRDGSDIGTVTISGRFINPSAVQKIQAKLTSITGGTTSSWVVMKKSRNTFSGKIIAPAGWYSLTVEALGAGPVPVAKVIVPHIGICDIFIIAGQSLGANYSNTINLATDDRMSCRSIVNTWRLADDPQLNDSNAPGSGGSAWPLFAQDMINYTGFPVATIDLNSGGSYVGEWTPGGSGSGQFYHFIRSAIQMFPINGFCCFLWVQGEQDAFLGTSTADYASQLVNVFSSARADCKWNFPVGIGSPETFLGPAFSVPPANYAAVAAGQTQAIATLGNAFAVDMDNNIPLIDRFDQTHPNHAGCVIMGNIWSQGVINFLGL